MERGRLVLALVLAWSASFLPARALAQAPSHAELLERLRQLEENQTKLFELLKAKDARLDQLESELQRAGVKEAPAAPAPADVGAAPPATRPLLEPETQPGAVIADAPPPAPTAPYDDEGPFGSYRPGRGFGLARTEWGEARLGIYTYLRYLNQKGLDDTFTNGLGEEVKLDRREDLELNKVKIEFRGWLMDPRFRYVLYTWTNQAVQGLGAQVVVAGNLNWVVDDWLTVGGGILSLPTTRSTSGNFPFWLTVDHRTITDEFFRGSYATGFYAHGGAHGIGYYAMLANNLSQLGVDAGQMDSDFTTFSGALWWMPTTGEFGPRSGFGDYEMHEDVATRLGVHFTFSPEDRQSQPGSEDIDNTQIRISNGTIVFTPGALAPDVTVTDVKYYMTDFDAGVKYRGFALEGEYYLRWLNGFDTDGPLPMDSLFDHGFQVMASAMVLPRTLQVYTTGAYLFGEFGEPWEVAAGVNWFVFKRRELRLNLEYIYDHESPIGYTAVPQAVGATGSIFNANLEMSF